MVCCSARSLAASNRVVSDVYSDQMSMFLPPYTADYLFASVASEGWTLQYKQGASAAATVYAKDALGYRQRFRPRYVSGAMRACVRGSLRCARNVWRVCARCVHVRVDNDHRLQTCREVRVECSLLLVSSSCLTLLLRCCSDIGLAAVTTGTVDNLHITHLATSPPSEDYLAITVTIRNMGDETLSGLRYLRTINPHQEMMCVTSLSFLVRV